MNDSNHLRRDLQKQIVDLLASPVMESELRLLLESDDKTAIRQHIAGKLVNRVMETLEESHA